MGPTDDGPKTEKPIQIAFPVSPVDDHDQPRELQSKALNAVFVAAFRTMAEEEETVTQRDKRIVQSEVLRIYRSFLHRPPQIQQLMMELKRDKHIGYLIRGLLQLGPSFRVLDANRPWLCYWMLHSIALLGEPIHPELKNSTIEFLKRCQDPEGGYGGGPAQMPHLATTYAAVNSLITLGGHESLSSINRQKLYSFFIRMKQPSGGYRMHDAGEIDVRASYTAISVASFLNILDDKLTENVGNYILSCQTYEGGISGEPGSEAHGGYTFCGLATMILINEVHRLDLAKLVDWVVFRQGGKEWGFQGRTNKLIDGCYSFWQGGVCSLLQRLKSLVDQQLIPQVLDSNMCRDNYESGMNVINLNDIGFEFIKKPAEKEPIFHSLALQQYILLCSQEEEGGMKDKPGKHVDFYHTCYCLSGLSLCQYSWSENEDAQPLAWSVAGSYTNLLEPIHPLFNVVMDRFYEAHGFFTTT